MSKIFVTSDWHLGEDRFEIMNRPFKSVLEHVDVLLDRHNAVVGRDDLVYVIGDVIYQKANATNWLPIISDFAGRKVLIRGNHDRNIGDDQFAPYFEQIVPDGGGLDVVLGGEKCWLTHYPTRGRVDRFNLVGHVHGCWKVQLNSLNVGVDVHHFAPIDAEKQVPFYFEAIHKFYDDDAWAGYAECNVTWRGHRGKKSVYFIDELNC